MQIIFQIPEDIAHRMQEKWGDVQKQAKEALVVEAYRSGILTVAEIQQILQFSSRWAVEEFLHQVGCELNYTEEDLKKDMQVMRGFRS